MISFTQYPLIAQRLNNYDWGQAYREMHYLSEAYPAHKNVQKAFEIARDGLGQHKSDDIASFALHDLNNKGLLDPKEIAEFNDYKNYLTFKKAAQEAPVIANAAPKKVENFFDAAFAEGGAFADSKKLVAEPPVQTFDAELIKAEAPRVAEVKEALKIETPLAEEMEEAVKQPLLKGLRDKLPSWMPGSLKETPIKVPASKLEATGKKWRISDTVPDFFKKKSKNITAEEKRFFSAEENLLDKHGETAIIGAGVLAAGGWAMHELNKRHAAVGQNTGVVKF